MNTGQTDPAAPGNNGHWLERADNARRQDSRRGPSWRERRRETTLAEWLGPERIPDRFAELRPEPPPMAALIDHILEHSGQAESYLLERLRQEWPAIVGDANARFLLPCTLREGVLTIEVTHPTWMYAIRGDQRERLDAAIIAFAHGRLQRVNYVPRGRFSR